MAAHHLRVHIGTYVVDRKLPRIGGDLALEHNLQKHVAELFAQVGDVLLLDCANGLVGFLYHVVGNRCVRLLAIPWTAVRGPEGRNRGDELVECWMVCRISVSVECAVRYLGARFGGIVFV